MSQQSAGIKTTHSSRTVIFLGLTFSVREKIDAQDMILDDITRKQLIWYGHVERMDPIRLPRIIIYWKP
jgi:hypothetical protein